LGCIFVIFDGTNIPELMEKQRQYEKQEVSYCDDGDESRQRDLYCIKRSFSTIDDDKIKCKKVLKDSYSYFREDVEKCKSIMKLD